MNIKTKKTNNIHSSTIPADILTRTQSRTEEIRMLLAPYITPFTPSQRHSIAKMGDKTLAFVEKVHELALRNRDSAMIYFLSKLGTALPRVR